MSNRKYESRYGGGQITAAQFLAEIMCERKAAIDKNDLPVKFWNNPKWKKFFCLQVIYANSLLKLYSDKAILSVLKDPRTKKIYSLRLEWLDPLFKEAQAKLDAQEHLEEPAQPMITMTDGETTLRVRVPFGKKTNFQKLRELDNE